MARQTPSWGKHIKSSGQVHCVRRLGLPEDEWKKVAPRSDRRIFGEERHVTCVKMSPEHADEVIVAFAKHSTSIFSTYDSPASASAKAKSTSPTMSRAIRNGRHRSASPGPFPDVPTEAPVPPTPVGADAFLRDISRPRPRAKSSNVADQTITAEPAKDRPPDPLEIESAATETGENSPVGKRRLSTLSSSHSSAITSHPASRPRTAEMSQEIEETGDADAPMMGPVQPQGNVTDGVSEIVSLVEEMADEAANDAADPIQDEWLASDTVNNGSSTMYPDESGRQAASAWGALGRPNPYPFTGISPTIGMGNLGPDIDDPTNIDDEFDEFDEFDDEDEDDELGFDYDDDEDLDPDAEEDEDMYGRVAAVRSDEGEFGDVEMILPRRSFKGARNVETVKDCNFLGSRSDKVCSGSDDGHFFVWDKDTGKLEGIYKGDGSVVNGA